MQTEGLLPDSFRRVLVGGPHRNDILAAAWRKSSMSAYNGNCVEVAELENKQVGVRDTKDYGDKPALGFTHSEWALFLCHRASAAGGHSCLFRGQAQGCIRWR